MAGEGEVTIRVPSEDQDRLKLLAKLMKAEGNGLELRKELIRNLRIAVAPGVEAVKGKLRGMTSTGRAEAQPALGSYLASRTRTQVRLSGRKTGVAVKIGQTPNIRGFRSAAAAVSRPSWRHPVYGRDTWVSQQSQIPDYFDGTLSERKAEYRAAVIEAVEAMERRIKK